MVIFANEQRSTPLSLIVYPEFGTLILQNTFDYVTFIILHVLGLFFFFWIIVVVHEIGIFDYFVTIQRHHTLILGRLSFTTTAFPALFFRITATCRISFLMSFLCRCNRTGLLPCTRFNLKSRLSGNSPVLLSCICFVSSITATSVGSAKSFNAKKIYIIVGHKDPVWKSLSHFWVAFCKSPFLTIR